MNEGEVGPQLQQVGDAYYNYIALAQHERIR